jgi:hypothetical protein
VELLLLSENQLLLLVFGVVLHSSLSKFRLKVSKSVLCGSRRCGMGLKDKMRKRIRSGVHFGDKSGPDLYEQKLGQKRFSDFLRPIQYERNYTEKCYETLNILCRELRKLEGNPLQSLPSELRLQKTY